MRLDQNMSLDQRNVNNILKKLVENMPGYSVRYMAGKDSKSWKYNDNDNYNYHLVWFPKENKLTIFEYGKCVFTGEVTAQQKAMLVALGIA